MEVAGIEEQHLAHLGPLLELRRVMVGDARGVGGAVDEAGELLEDVARREAVGLQDQLALQELQVVEAPAIEVGAVIALGKPHRQHQSMLVA